jgi:uncharacterized protein (TIGR02996 family)
MSRNRNRREPEAREDIADQAEDWQRGEASWWSFGNCTCEGRLRHLCRWCENALAGAEAHSILTAREDVLGLVGRWGQDPAQYVEAVVRERQMGTALLMIEAAYPEVVAAREAQWRLLCHVLAQVPALDPTAASACDSSSSWGRELACKNVPAMAPSREAAVDLLRLLLTDPQCGVRGWAALHLADLAPQTSGLTDALVPLLACTCRTVEVGIDWVNLSNNGSGEGRAWGHLAVNHLHSLGIYPRLSDIPCLLERLAQGERHLRLSSIQSLTLLGQLSAEIFCALERPAEAYWEDPEVRRAAREALASLTAKLRHGDVGPHPQEPEERFLLGIWEDPGDQAVRLIYADWLEDHGARDRARLIRVLCSAGNTQALSEDASREVEAAREEVRQGPAGNVRWLDLWDYLTLRTIPR